MKANFILILILSFSLGYSQIPEYFGAGSDSNMTVSASSTLIDTVWPSNPIPENTINGTGLDAAYMEAGRFLMQASVGFEEYHIEEVMNLGFEAWIDDQFQKSPSNVLPHLDSLHFISIDSFIMNGGDSMDIPNRPDYRDFNQAWWDLNMKNEDLLRHRVATALMEIMVISRINVLGSYGYGMGAYYDVLLDGAFGNYEDLLRNVSLSPAMGVYLTHVNNPKTDTSTNAFPDENYAREVMQLFSIGLLMLNNDGTLVLDNGEEVNTYNNLEIAEFAKIFTGLSYGGVYYKSNKPSPYFGMPIGHADMTVPMIMFEDDHEPGNKYLLDSVLVPSGLTGMQDIDSAINILFSHQNVGPFITLRLIQRLVKSNPSPQYIDRVASKFNDDGNGVRGNMRAVIKAILMDEEARDCSYQLDDKNSRLKEPIFRYSHFARMIKKFRPADDYFWNNSYYFWQTTGQDLMASPSVLNFFAFDDTPNGEIKNAGLVAPEFKIHNALSSIGYINRVDRWVRSDLVFTNGESSTYWDDRYTRWDRSMHEPYYDDSEVFLNWLDRNIIVGQLSDQTRNTMREVLKTVPYGTNEGRYRIQHAAFIALMSADYCVIR